MFVLYQFHTRTEHLYNSTQYSSTVTIVLYCQTVLPSCEKSAASDIEIYNNKKLCTKLNLKTIGLGYKIFTSKKCDFNKRRYTNSVFAMFFS